MLIDTHSHLLSRAFFTLAQAEEIIKESARQNIIIVESLLEPERYEENLKIIEKYNNVFATLGFLELEVSKEQVEKAIGFMKKYINHPKVVGIGEIGMDFFRETNRENQEQNFRQLLDFAKTTDLPVIVHSRAVGKYCFNILEEKQIKQVIFHCFEGSIKLTKRIVEKRWFISISTNVLYREDVQKYVKKIPLEYFVLETDSPFLHPLRKKEEKNTPLNLKFSVEKISEITSKSKDDVAKITSQNANKILNLNV
ncbi:MAG: hypothetical protein COY63_01760 [Candidatus Huberarchaeum crystalense]|uniref:DNase n=1 Tax=Huberarchaeum crystalense TaxID=2014257 RepID=A0A2H9P9Y5_HUBC1|nr:MAG: hypothetical protein AUK59_00385 [Candidatus Altarchaeum sp. CG2_30_32_3053]PIV13770.1 MAG: hypothetical protein COS45_01165 [Candidatus Huberarchaeum crystalense]PIY99764.1 MAG: hypothetical protein COY63_01760 [Candidatus Huberarchaeum crystalense]